MYTRNRSQPNSDKRITMFSSNSRHTLYSDDSIRQTDSDAAGARLSAAQKLYFEDNFIKDFVPRAHLQPSRPPLINIGTHARSTGIDALVHKWLDCSTLAGKRSQIVSLGAGSDTRFWRLAVGGPVNPLVDSPSHTPLARQARIKTA
jgi:hypothetical protein